MALLISWRMRPSTPARVLSRDCWEPLVLRMTSMLAALGGAAKAVAAVKERIMGRSFREVFMTYFKNLGYVSVLI